MQGWKLTLLTAVFLLLIGSTVPANVQAVPVGTAPCVTGGAATGTGPWTLTATPSTVSFVTCVTLQNPTFAELTNLNAVFASISGGGGGGSPRFRLLLDADGSGTVSAGDKSVTIHLGSSPGFVDTDAQLDTFSGMNLIGNNDAGRYDTSAFVGGSPFTDYNSTLALVGGLAVLRLGIVVDTFRPFPDRELQLFSLNAEVEGAASVAEPSGTLGFVSLVIASLIGSRRSKKRQP